MEQQAYQRSRDGFLEFVGTLYFALECRVFQREIEFLQFWRQLQLGLGEEAMRARIRDFKLEDDTKSAALAGLARGKKPGECDYWLNNPEHVFRLRRLAASAQ